MCDTCMYVRYVYVLYVLYVRACMKVHVQGPLNACIIKGSKRGTVIVIVIVIVIHTSTYLRESCAGGKVKLAD